MKGEESPDNAIIVNKMAASTNVPFPVIAIVEDDAAVRQAISFSLMSEGYPVRTFHDAETLLAADDLGQVGCFVVDQQLPRAQGLATLQELQRRGLPGRAVLITTRPPESLRKACWDMGVPIVEKPLLGESLNACIRGLLARPSSS